MTLNKIGSKIALIALVNAFALASLPAFADQAAVQQDTAKVQQDKQELQSDRKEVQDTQQKLAADKAAGNTSAVAQDKATLKAERVKRHEARKALKADRTKRKQDAGKAPTTGSTPSGQ